MTNFYLSDTEKLQLLRIAKQSIEMKIVHNKKYLHSANETTDNLLLELGAFVSLHSKGKLRGCVGQFKPQIPIYKLIAEMAVASSTQDSRFRPVKEHELKDLEIEISILTPMVKISSIDEIILGKHGIYIKKGFSNGTFLPQVASETKWNLEEFLGHCSRDKAGIGWDGWKIADIYIYEAIIFDEQFSSL